MIPIVEKNLQELKESEREFRDIYRIITGRFSREVFGEQIIDGKVLRTTYREWAEMICHTSNAIRERYGRQGSQVIGIYMENSVIWTVLFWGILKAGFIPLLLNTRMDRNATLSVIEEIQPICIFSEQDTVSGSISYQDLMQGSDTERDINGTDNTDQEEHWENRIILVTSGSTGKPGIIVHTGAAISRQIELSSEIIKKNITLRHNRRLEVRMLAFLPFYHIFGLVAVLMWFSFFGRTFLFLPDYGVNTIQHICRRLRATHFFAVPMVWEGVAEKVYETVCKEGKEKSFNRILDFSNYLQTVLPHIGSGIVRNLLFRRIRREMLGTDLHFLISGGGRISDKALRIINGLGYSLYSGYGLTECGIVSVNLSRRAKERIEGGNGEIFSNIIWRTDKGGELEIENNCCFAGRYVDGIYEEFTDTYYKTGDIVSFGKNGGLFIEGRRDDMIVTSTGENLFPEAIEQQLDLKDFSAASVCYVLFEEKPQLLLIIEPDEKLSAADQAAAVRRLYASIDTLPMISRPSQIMSVMGKLPRSLKGVNRKELVQQICEGKIYLEPCTLPSDQDLERYRSEEYVQILSQVKECFAKVLNIEEDISDTASFVNLGGNSMMYVELLEVIYDRMQVRITFGERPRMTPAAFADYITSAQEERHI